MSSVGNIIVRCGADTTALTESMKQAQNTILSFKNDAMSSLKSFGIPNINTTNLVQSIQSGNRVVADFTQEAGESLEQFQNRVRTTFQQAGIDVTQYESVLQKATSVHAQFANGAVKSFQAVTDSTEQMSTKSQGLIGQFRDQLTGAFQTMTDSTSSFGDKSQAVSGLVNTAFTAMTGTIVVFLALKVVETLAGWMDSLEKLAATAEDTEHRFEASTGLMSDQAEKFAESLSKSYGISELALKDMMGTEYLNTRNLGFDPSQAEQMSEKLTQLSYDLGKLRGEDPSEVFQKLQTGIEGQTRGLSQLGIRLTNADIQNRALAEGLIKPKQALDDQTKSFVIYQDILDKTKSLQGYYLQTTGDLSTQSTKLKTQFEQMTVTLASALTPAFKGFLEVVNVVVEDLGYVVDAVAFVIQSIELLVAGLYHTFQDIDNLNFGAIGQSWINTYNAIFTTSDAAKQYGAAMDQGTSATNAQDAALQQLGASLNANTMSFDQLHNMTTTASQSGIDDLNNLADAFQNLSAAGGPAGSSLLSGLSTLPPIKIPLIFGPIPPTPAIPQPPAVVIEARDEITDILAAIAASLALWAASTEAVLASWAVATEAILTAWSTATEAIVTAWETVSKAGLAAWSSVTEAIFTGWEAVTETVLAAWAATTEATLAAWSSVTEATLVVWGTVSEAGLGAWAVVTKATLAAWETVTEVGLASWSAITKATMVGWEAVTEAGLATWAVATKATLAAWAATTEGTFAAWSAASEGILAAWDIVTEVGFVTWEAVTEAGLGAWAVATEGILTGFVAAADLILGPWALVAEGIFAAFALISSGNISKFTAGLRNAFDEVCPAVESIIVNMANSVGETLTNMVDEAIAELNKLIQGLDQLLGKNIPQVAAQAWSAISAATSAVSAAFEANKSWIVPAAIVAGAVGVTVATGGLDLAAAAATAGLAATVPALAAGGVATAPMLAMIGEHGNEAVIPLNQMTNRIPSRGGGSSGGGQSSSQPINLTLKLDGRVLARATFPYNMNETDRIGNCIGYQSSYNYPK